METLKLPQDLARQILNQARSSPDVEICGLIAARDGYPCRCIPVPNVAQFPERLFTMDPARQIDAHRSMREQGEALFGIYHSHPLSSAEPSQTDIDQAAYPDAVYIIVSLNGRRAHEMRGYRIRNRKATRVQLDIGNDVKS